MVHRDAELDLQNAPPAVQLIDKTVGEHIHLHHAPGGLGVDVRAGVEIPKDPANGDYTTTFALAAAKAMKKSPREIASALLEHLDLRYGHSAPPPGSPRPARPRTSRCPGGS